MKKILSLMSVLYCWCYTAKSQAPKVEELLRPVITEVKKFNEENIFVADTILKSFPYSYNDLKSHVSDSDLLLLKEILNEFASWPVNPESLTDIWGHTNYRMSLDKFVKWQPAPVQLSKSETCVVEKMEIIENLFPERDDPAYSLAERLRDSLYVHPDYLAAKRKFLRLDKRLLFISPILENESGYLVVMNAYRAIGDRFLIVRLIRK